MNTTADLTTVPVSLGERAYDIHIGKGLLARAAEYIAPLLKRNRVFIITDEHIKKAGHLDTLVDALMAGDIVSHTIVLPAGEQTKSFASLENVLGQFLDHQPERKDTLIALGGGVIGDLTGFAASILLRGVPFIQIPTTLLAMVDSSVGGKTGINTPHGKNLVGSFYQPSLVLADTDLLETLPEREWLAGYAEVVKYGLIDQPEFFEWLESKGKDVDISQAIRVSCEAKARVVAADEREGGQRALLNLGHTFAHALEAEMGYDGRLLHGEAVAIGMVMAADYSVHCGLCPEGDAQRIKHHLEGVGLHVSPAGLKVSLTAEKMLKHMYQDKKVSGGKLVLILLRGIGKSFIAQDVDGDSLQQFLEQYL